MGKKRKGSNYFNRSKVDLRCAACDKTIRAGKPYYGPFRMAMDYDCWAKVQRHLESADLTDF